MAFIEELPSAEDIKKFDLPFALDLEKPVEHRRTWFADHGRGVYLTGVGYTGNPAFDDYEHIKASAGFYLGRKKFKVILERYIAPDDFNANPYSIHYPDLLKIYVYTVERGMFDVLPEVSKLPGTQHAFLQNYSLNEFVLLFKEALTARKAGDSNKYIPGIVNVSFGF